MLSLADMHVIRSLLPSPCAILSFTFFKDYLGFYIPAVLRHERQYLQGSLLHREQLTANETIAVPLPSH